jgi:NADPH:quinone reductase-like Zn-dependent oxidoreductase
MRAIRLHEVGEASKLRVDELPEPTPGPGEAAVRVRATSLNYRDLMVRSGAYNPQLKTPFVPLSDGAGEVSVVGPGVTRVKPGDRVAAAFMPGWIAGRPTEDGGKTALGAGGIGMLAETVVLPAEGLVAIPDHLTFEEAATLPCAAVTAWHALVEEGNLRAGETVLIQGTGGVSIFALQIATLFGARVIVTSSSDEKLEKAIALGATDGINYKTTPEWDKAVRSLTGGEGVDHVVEVGGAGTLGRSLRAARLGGRVSVIGVLSGVTGEVDTRPILMKNLTVQGIYVGSRAMFEAMNRAITLHRLRPIVDRAFKLDEAEDAYERMRSGSHFGKIVIRL